MMTIEEKNKGANLYNKMISEHYGNIKYKSAKDRYEKFVSETASKYEISPGAIRSEIMAHRNIQQEEER